VHSSVVGYCVSRGCALARGLALLCRSAWRFAWWGCGDVVSVERSRCWYRDAAPIRDEQSPGVQALPCTTGSLRSLSALRYPLRDPGGAFSQGDAVGAQGCARKEATGSDKAVQVCGSGIAGMAGRRTGMISEAPDAVSRRCALSRGSRPTCSHSLSAGRQLFET